MRGMMYCVMGTIALRWVIPFSMKGETDPKGRLERPDSGESGERIGLVIQGFANEICCSLRTLG